MWFINYSIIDVSSTYILVLISSVLFFIKYYAIKLVYFNPNSKKNILIKTYINFNHLKIMPGFCFNGNKFIFKMITFI